MTFRHLIISVRGINAFLSVHAVSDSFYGVVSNGTRSDNWSASILGLNRTDILDTISPIGLTHDSITFGYHTPDYKSQRTIVIVLDRFSRTIRSAKYVESSYAFVDNMLGDGEWSSLSYTLAGMHYDSTSAGIQSFQHFEVSDTCLSDLETSYGYQRIKHISWSSDGVMRHIESLDPGASISVALLP